MPERHDEILRAIGRIEGKIDGILDEAKRTNGRVTRLEENVGSIKVNVGVNTAKLGFIGVVAGLIGSFILKFFN